jgi:ABC-type dipeptide/oligopeptide/nickel transport system permease component
MPKLSVTHFEAALLFAIFSSIVLGVVSKKTDHERLRYGVRCFGYFLVALFAVGWIMYLGHG